ncbi:MAG: hypothetical protein J6D57_12200, partial [Mogibacterium sp.]|nr:hypothetical protein [Mogibacterium sp.]
VTAANKTKADSSGIQSGNGVKTGDRNSLFIWLVMLIASLIGSEILVFKRIYRNLNFLRNSD